MYQSVSFRRLVPLNTDRSLVRGVEAELATAPLRPAAGLAVQAAYTYTDSQVLRGRADEGRARPRPAAQAAPPALRASRGRRTGRRRPRRDQWISRQWLGFGHARPVGEALTFGAGASVRLWRAAGLRLHLEVRNLLDVRTLDDSFGNPLPGRTVLVTLRAGTPTSERP